MSDVDGFNVDFTKTTTYSNLFGRGVSIKKGPGIFHNRQPLDLLVPGTRLELVRGKASRDFKSLASTSSATQAFFTLL
jgi:hypothetical protein